MNDKLSLLAATAGGFMLSVAVAGMVHAAPVTSLQAQANFSSQVPSLRTASVSSHEGKKNFCSLADAKTLR